MENNKALIFSDIHIHPHKKSQERLEDCLKALEWVFETAKKNNIKNIICLGDLFHDRRTIDILSYNKTFDIFEKYQHSDSPFNIYLLLGNHDLWYYERLDVSSVSPFKNIPNTTVINKPCTINISGFPVSFLPFTHNPIEELKKINNNNNYKVLMGHVAINGASLNPHAGTVSEVSVENDNEMILVSSNEFKEWNHVFLGHYHAEQVIDGFIEYVGSPLQLDFGEVFQQKHIIIYDLETHDKEYVINDFSPKHLIISDEKQSNYSLKNNFVILETSKDVGDPDIIDMRNKVSNAEVKSVVIRRKSKEIKEDKKDIEILKLNLTKSEDMIASYIEHLSSSANFNFDKEKLKKFGLSICSRSKVE